MPRITRQFGEWYATITSDIFKFCEALNFEPTWQQRQLLEAVQRGDLRIAVKSGQGPGKSCCTAAIGLWRCLRDPGALVIVTAPTMRQCTEVWMGEARRHLGRADPTVARLFQMSNTRITVNEERDWGVKLVTATKPEAAHGFHEPNMTIIFEEASGIDKEIITQFKGTSSNPNCLHIMIGNPTARDCAFFDCFYRMRHSWTTFTWNAEETPESSWFSRQRNVELAEEFGADSDVYRIRVLGEFPQVDPNCVVSIEEVQAVMDRKLIIPMSRLSRAKQFGMDFARFGGAENTIYRRSGNAVVEWGYYPHLDPNDAIEKAFVMQLKAGWRDDETLYVADAGGMGQGVMRRFYDYGKQVAEFHSENTAQRGRQFKNKITEAYFNLAALIRQGKCALPLDPRLVEQLTTRQYHFVKADGRIVLEPKDDYITRGHNSPDRADGLVMCYYDTALLGNLAALRPPSERVGSEVWQ